MPTTELGLGLGAAHGHVTVERWGQAHFRVHDVEKAKALCRECPARAACLAGALKRREPWGVWGGELFLRGAIAPRKRPLGRPRKTDAAA